MGYTIYKPNKAVKGALFNANFTAKADKEGEKGDKSFYFRLVGQTAWDSKKSVGSFKDGANITVKMAPHEIAGIICAIRKNISLSEAMGVEYIYHDGEETATIINFGPHFKREKNEEGEWKAGNVQMGFALRVTKKNKSDKDDKSSLGVGLTLAEAELLSKFLDDGLTHICDAWFSEEIARLKDYKSKGNYGQKDAKKKTETPQEDTGSGDDDPDDDDVTF